MASTTRSKRLCLVTYGAAGSNVVYTVPAGTITIVKFVQLHNASGGPATAQLYATDATSGSTHTFQFTSSLAAADRLGGITWFVLQAGDHLTAFCSGAGYDVMAAGAELPAA